MTKTRLGLSDSLGQIVNAKLDKEELFPLRNSLAGSVCRSKDIYIGRHLEHSATLLAVQESISLEET